MDQFSKNQPLVRCHRLDRKEEQEIPSEIIKAEEKLLSKKINLSEQILAAEELARHPLGGERLLNLAASSKLPQEIYSNSSIANLLFNHPDQKTRILAGEFFDRSDGTHLSVPEIVQLKGEPASGAILFNTHCISCHKMGAKGREIGPDLKNIRRKFDKNGLADAILNPNAAVAFGYEPVMIRSKADQVYSGFLLSEGTTTVIKDLEGIITHRANRRCGRKRDSQQQLNARSRQLRSQGAGYCRYYCVFAGRTCIVIFKFFYKKDYIAKFKYVLRFYNYNRIQL